MRMTAVARGRMGTVALVALAVSDPSRSAAADVAPARDGMDPVVAALVEDAAEAVELEPRSAEARARLCMAYEANLLWPEAARCYPLLGDLEPRQALWKLHEARARLESGEIDAARRLLELALELEPELAAARHRLADLLVEAGELERAQQLFEELVRDRPERPEGYLGAGEVDLLAGRIERATERLERAVALDPGLAAAHYQLGLAYRAAGRLDEARRELALGAGAARRYLPSPLDSRLAELRVHMTAQVDRAAELLAAGRDAEAAALLESLVDRAPANATLRNDLAVAYLRQDRLDAARSQLDRALELEPAAFGTYLNLSAWAARAGDVAAAVEFARRALELAPGVAATHLALARTLGDRRYLASLPDASAARGEMLAELDRALSLGVGTPDPYLLLARERWRDGRGEEALETLAAALRRWPDFWPGHLMRAWILARAGRVAAAEQSLATVRELAPGHPDVAEIERLIAAGRSDGAD